MPDPSNRTISATEAPALIDASPWLTRWMLYQKFAKGLDLSTAPNSRMDWGLRMEKLVVEAVAEELKLEVIPNHGDDGKQVYERRGQFGTHRDATIICPDRGVGALETKCVFDYGVWMREWSGGKAPPRHHEIQLQVQMMVGDGERPYQWGCLSAWLAGELHHFERKPIPGLWKQLEVEAQKFFDDVAAGREPDPFGAPVEAPFLAEAFPTIAGKTLTMDEANTENLKVAEQVRMLTWHSAERLGHEKAEKDIKAQLLALAKDNEEVVLPYGIRVKIQRQERKGYEVKPTTVVMVKPYVPKTGVPEGNFGDE